MNHRPLRSAMVLSLGALLAFAGSVAADTARADGDATLDSVVDLGALAPGEVRSVDIGIVLTCAGTTHVDPGQTVTAIMDSATAPEGGLVLSVTDGTVGPAPADWTPDGQPCPLPAPMFTTGTPSVVTLRAPTTPGVDYRFSLQYHRTIEPFGANDPLAVRQLTAVDILLDVVSNTPPTLIPPTVAGGGTIEADTTGGWTADWSGLSAMDAEDDPDPTATCSPAAGTVLPLGPTTVTCSVTDQGGLTTSASFALTVVNTPPTLTLPSLAGVGTVEGNHIGGWSGSWLGLGATDVEDDPDPTATCSPVAGTILPLGPTTVTCSVTDSGGLTASASFALTVEDTRAPTMLSVPEDFSVTTDDPTGTTVGYGTPSAMDLVDSHPAVNCLPASGTHFNVGTTPVTCTATDASNNSASRSFTLTVTQVTPHTASAIWGEPVAGTGSTFVANQGRNVPVKVQLFVSDVARTSGAASLAITPCTGGSPVIVDLTYGSGRWNASLDTGGLAGSCHTVEASIDGVTAGSFRLELRGSEPTKANTPQSIATITSTPTAAPAPTAKPAPSPAAKPAPASVPAPGPKDKTVKTDNGKN